MAIRRHYSTLNLHFACKDNTYLYPALLPSELAKRNSVSAYLFPFRLAASNNCSESVSISIIIIIIIITRARIIKSFKKKKKLFLPVLDQKLRFKKLFSRILHNYFVAASIRTKLKPRSDLEKVATW